MSKVDMTKKNKKNFKDQIKAYIKQAKIDRNKREKEYWDIRDQNIKIMKSKGSLPLYRWLMEKGAKDSLEIAKQSLTRRISDWA